MSEILATRTSGFHDAKYCDMMPKARHSFTKQSVIVKAAPINAIIQFKTH
jgi:hypothetical protein